MTVDDFAAAGLYDPSAPNAAQRLELLEWLAARGATLAEMVDAHRENRLLQLAGRLAARPGPFITSCEVAERVGPGLRCEPAGRRLLRGFDEPVSILNVVRG